MLFHSTDIYIYIAYSVMKNDLPVPISIIVHPDIAFDDSLSDADRETRVQTVQASSFRGLVCLGRLQSCSPETTAGLPMINR